MDRIDLEVPAIDAVGNYLAPSVEKPVNYTFRPPPGVPRRSGTPEPHTVSVRNARALARRPWLDVEGFALLDHPIGSRSFRDEESRSAYEREVEEVLKSTTRADR